MFNIVHFAFFNNWHSVIKVTLSVMKVTLSVIKVTLANSTLIFILLRIIKENKEPAPAVARLACKKISV